LGAVARDIVTRRLRLADDRDDLPDDQKEGE
jgi:hypothetical protein